MKISILTPVYNGAEYIEKAIQSVLNQNYSNIEHIIMDGNSTDGTQQILQKYPHLIWTSEPDNGQSDAMNKAFDKCTGDIIAYLNSDDYFEPNVFKQVMNAFEQNPNTHMVVGNLYWYKNINAKKMLIKPTTNYYILLFHFIFRYQFPSNPVCYFYKKEVQQKIGKFGENEHYTMDFWFLLHAYKNFKITKINTILGNFVMTTNSKTINSDFIQNGYNCVTNFCKQNDKVAYFLYLFVFKIFAVLRSIKNFVAHA